MVLVFGSILGGLPVMAEINCGMSEGTWVSDAEFYSEVEAIYWWKKGDKPGKEIPAHLWERAYEYDYMFADLIQNGLDWLAFRDHEEKEMVQLDGEPGNPNLLARKEEVT